jgi:clathrin heavy chain
VDDLLRSFCEIKEKESFCATLYTCYELVSPDVALELGWRNGFVDFIVPFMVETFRKTHLRLAELEKKVSPPEEEVAKAEMSNACVRRARDPRIKTNSPFLRYGQQSGVFGNSLMITNGGGPAGFDPATGGYPGDPSVAGPLYGAPMTMSMGMGGGYQ